MRATAADPRESARLALWRRTSAAGAVLVAVGAGAYFLTAAVVPLGARAVVRTIELAARAVVWLALAFQGGLDLWGVLAVIGRRAGELLVTPRATLLLVVIELVGAVALYALYRLVVSDKESLK